MRIPVTATALLLAAAASVSGAVETTVSRQSGEDLYAAGASVQVSQPVPGDAVLAGGSVLVAGEIAQDLLAAGGSVTVTRAVADDIRAAGGSVTVTDRVGGDAIAAGGSVTLAAGSVVDGNAWVAGGVVHLSGSVNGNVSAAGGEVTVGGRVEGDVDVFSESLTIPPGTTIAGTLHYRGPAPAAIADDADVNEVLYTKSDIEGPGVSFLGAAMAALLVLVSLAVCTMLFAWLLPKVCRPAADNARSRPVLSLGVGLLTVVAVPVAAAALFALMVTLPAAVVLLAAYVILWIAGGLVALAGLGAWLRRRFMTDGAEGAGTHALSILAAALIYWVVSLLPFVGALVVVLAFIAGAGGLILLAARLYKKPGEP